MTMEAYYYVFSYVDDDGDSVTTIASARLITWPSRARFRRPLTASILRPARIKATRKHRWRARSTYYR
eukprot:scaffold147483_cov16-Prasinocladus_malaysianus.AAC.1